MSNVTDSVTPTHTLPPIYVALLHEQMLDRLGRIVTTSLTLIDVHDIARSSTTYGIKKFFVAHPSPTLQRLSMTLKTHWLDGFGATYNPNRKEALQAVNIVSTLDDVIGEITKIENKPPTIIATSAKRDREKATFKSLRAQLAQTKEPHLIVLGTGWGMCESLISRADIFLEPINGPSEFNHLSVRSACAIILDRLFGL